MSTRKSPASSSPSSDSEVGDDLTARQTSLTSDTAHVPTIDVGDLASTLINEAPEPQQHAIEQAAADRAQSVEDNKDAEGAQFDPSIHTGTKTTAGAWRKKSGRKAGGSTAGASRPKLNIPNANASDVAGSVGQAENSKVASSRATGKMAANLFLMLSCGLGGAEWMPRTVPMDEKAMLEEGFADYFQSKEWEDMPPGIALVACLGMYALPRFAMPKTQERAKGFKNWIAGKYITWKANRARKAYARKWGPNPSSDIERADEASRAAYAREVEARREAEGKLV